MSAGSPTGAATGFAETIYTYTAGFGLVALDKAVTAALQPNLSLSADALAELAQQALAEKRSWAEASDQAILIMKRLASARRPIGR